MDVSVFRKFKRAINLCEIKGCNDRACCTLRVTNADNGEQVGDSVHVCLDHSAKIMEMLTEKHERREKDE